MGVAAVLDVADCNSASKVGIVSDDFALFYRDRTDIDHEVNHHFRENNMPLKERMCDCI